MEVAFIPSATKTFYINYEECKLKSAITTAMETEGFILTMRNVNCVLSHDEGILFNVLY